MGNTIRILHMIGGLDLGGSQAFVMNIYRNINRDLVQFDFILDHPSERYLEDEIKSLGGKIFELPAFNGKNALVVKREWKKFLDAHSEYKVLHSHIRSYASLYIPIAKRKGLKTIIHSHSTSNGHGFSSLAKAILQYPLRYQADYFFACSPEAGEWLFGKRICKTDKFKVLKNAIDIKKFTYSDSKRSKVRQELGINQDEVVIGFIGRVTEPKNPLFIIDIFYELTKINNNIKLLFVGDGNLLQTVKSRAKTVGVENKIIFAGTRNDANILLSAMDLFLFPSLWEGLGISLIEAQASGIKCICSERIPNSAIITDLVDVANLDNDAHFWADKISHINLKYARNDTSKIIADAGYDINRTTNYLEAFYISHSIPALDNKRG